MVGYIVQARKLQAIKLTWPSCVSKPISRRMVVLQSRLHPQWKTLQVLVEIYVRTVN